jgi:two-component system NtrC family sensor kinase
MTIRSKLTMTAIAVTALVNSLLLLVALQYVEHVRMREVQAQVALNLNSARAAYRSHIAAIEAFLRGLALDRALAAAVERHDSTAMQPLLDRAQRSQGMDLLSLVDAHGKAVCRAAGAARRGDDLSGNALVARALADKQPVHGTVVLSAGQLAVEGAELAKRARIALVDTPTAEPTSDTIRSDGMVLAVAVPLLDAQGRLAAVLYAGDLLSRRYEIVDAIRRQVFSHAEYEGQEIGTVAISQRDVRVATTFALADGSRAVGTRLSAAVADAVLGHGQTWHARAFVINDWYLTAYEPIRDPGGQVVGVLSIGLRQAPIVRQQYVVTGVLLGMVLAATVASLVLIFLVTNAVLRPIGAVVAMSRKVIGGDLSARVGLRPAGEMGVLCRAVDGMARALAEREEQLKRATSQQLGRSEKLASVGRLAAGVAHEINNPLTGVLSFACLLRDKPNMDEQDRQDLDLIVHETTRAAQIVRGLLDFARERQVIKTPLDLNEVIGQTTRLLGNQRAMQGIVIVEDLADALPTVEGDAHQIEQVMLNLAMNACEAMPNGGTLLISSLAADGKVFVKFTDTGCGIKEEHLDQIFEPFFSTKPVGKGTGLGLSVSYGILQEHGGALEVESKEGKGSTFTVVLPCTAEPAEPTPQLPNSPTPQIPKSLNP